VTDFDRQFRTLLVTSASPSEGKRHCNPPGGRARAAASRTLVIDGDLRRPSVHKRFGMQNTLGLFERSAERPPWREALLSPPEFPIWISSRPFNIAPRSRPDRRRLATPARRVQQPLY